jgi:diazepam-binding inhibitor (GABA receptor modulating acyl-CoA-binding protein)
MPGQIGWIDLTVPDAPALRDFYQGVTGWTPSPVEMGGYQDFCMHPPGEPQPAIMLVPCAHPAGSWPFGSASQISREVDASLRVSRFGCSRLKPSRFTELAWRRRNMSALQARFKQAQQDVNGLAKRPDNITLLRLYALYKQATAGDADDERPGSLDFVRGAKYDAWDEIRGTSADDAMQQYIDLAAKLTR